MEVIAGYLAEIGVASAGVVAAVMISRLSHEGWKIVPRTAEERARDIRLVGSAEDPRG